MSLPSSLPPRQHVYETDTVPSVSPLTQPQPQSGASRLSTDYQSENRFARAFNEEKEHRGIDLRHNVDFSK